MCVFWQNMRVSMPRRACAHVPMRRERVFAFTCIACGSHGQERKHSGVRRGARACRRWRLCCLVLLVWAFSYFPPLFLAWAARGAGGTAPPDLSWTRTYDNTQNFNPTHTKDDLLPPDFLLVARLGHIGGHGFGPSAVGLVGRLRRKEEGVNMG